MEICVEKCARKLLASLLSMANNLKTIRAIMKMKCRRQIKKKHKRAHTYIYDVARMMFYEL